MIEGFYSPHLSLESEFFQIQPRRYFLRKLEVRSQKPDVFMKLGSSKKESEINNQVSYSTENFPSAIKEVFPRIKILMCSNSLNLTGAPLHQLEIALKLAKDGILEPIIFLNSNIAL